MMMTGEEGALAWTLSSHGMRQDSSLSPLLISYTTCRSVTMSTGTVSKWRWRDGGRELTRERGEEEGGGTHEVDGAAGEETLVSGIELLLSSKVPAVDVVRLRLTHITITERRNDCSGTSDNGHSEQWTTSLQWTNCPPPAYILPIHF